ncbi:MAG: SH3 domain-containing protein [Bacteroidota bacterium]
MQKQSHFLYKVPLFVVLWLVFPMTNYASNKSLVEADSLFVNKKYTESFGIYNGIFEQGQYSPAMILKMAFIKEGLSDYTSALYYLDFYFKLTSDFKVLTKMEELAEKNELKGYKSSDFDYFISIYFKHKTKLSIILSLVCILLFSIVLRQKLKGVRSYGTALLFLLFTSVLFYISNFDLHSKKAIIIGKNAYLMEGPSPGSEPVVKVEKGHKVKIIEEGEVWSKITWENQEAYIRSSHIINLL